MSEVTLPPAQISYPAPIGDAALEYMEKATLYLPSYDGISLSTVETQIAYSPVRPNAESLVRALLAHAGTNEARSIGGDVRLSLYGTSPVEVSRNAVTINLGASALQLDRRALYLACQAIANTLSELTSIDYVNILVVDKPIGLDIANSLPMGALSRNSTHDLSAVYDQLLSRRTDAAETSGIKPFSANVSLYFPLLHTEGMVSEVRSVSFENQNLTDMVAALLYELAAGPRSADIHSPALPLLGDLLTATPELIATADNGNILSLEFAHNLYDMLDAYQISSSQCMASLCYTLCTFFPNVNGIQVAVGGTSVDPLMQVETETNATSVVPMLRSSFAANLLDYCTLYFANADSTSLVAVKRPLPYYQVQNPRMLLNELSKGPQASDSLSNHNPVIFSGELTDTDMLGFALRDGTLLANFAPSFAELGRNLNAQQERLMAYALVNTLCMDEHIKSVCFFMSGNQFDTFSGEIYWSGLFYPLPL